MTIRTTPMGIVFIVVLILLPFVLWMDGEFFVRWLNGAPGLLVITVLAFVGNSTVLWPAPMLGTTMPVMIQLAEQNGIILVSAFYAVGAALGETSGYFAGRKGADIPLFGNSRWHQTLERWLRRRSLTDFALVILSAFPVILPFDVGGMIAGSIRHPWWRFVISTFLGRWFKYWAFIKIWHKVANLSGYLGWAAFVCAFLAVVIIVWRYRKALLSQWRFVWRCVITGDIHIRVERRWGW